MNAARPGISTATVVVSFTLVPPQRSMSLLIVDDPHESREMTVAEREATRAWFTPASLLEAP